MKDITPTDKDDSPPLNILMLITPQHMYVNTMRDFCEAFDLFSSHSFSFASSKKEAAPDGEMVERKRVDYSGFDVLMIHYSVRVAFWEGVVDEGVMDAIRKFSGYKILFVQDEYDRTEAVRERINALGIDRVYTCVPNQFIEQVYPKKEFQDVKFINILTGYISPSLERDQYTIPLAERPYGIVYRGRSLSYAYGELGQEKLMIGKIVKDVCMGKGIPEDIEWTEDKRIYRADWDRFLQSGRATLGTESGANVFDIDGSIQQGLKDALLVNPELSYAEAKEKLFSEENIGVKMNQISPKFFEFIASRTALILYEGEYSGILEPNVHYLPLKKDGSNLDAILDSLSDVNYLEEMTERAYRDIVASGEYSYRRFVNKIDAELDDLGLGQGLKFEGVCRANFQTPIKTNEDLSKCANHQSQQDLVKPKLALCKAKIAELTDKKDNFTGMMLRRKEKILKLQKIQNEY